MIGKLVVVIFKAYQYLVSPWLGPHCRFHPSCSHYGIQALEDHGVVKGGQLLIRRLLKCHPFHPGGIDLVPAPVDPLSPIADSRPGL